MGFHAWVFVIPDPDDVAVQFFEFAKGPGSECRG